MELKFSLPDGNIIEGNNYAQVVKSMAAYKLLSIRSLKGYRTETARRTMEMYNIKIDPHNNESFIESMVESGLLKKLSTS